MAVKVSIIKSCRNSGQILKNVTINNVLDSIKNEEFKEIVHRIRTLKADGDEETGDKIKISELPAFTACGTFDKIKSSNNIDEYTGLVVLDIDDITPEIHHQVKNLLADIKYSYVVFSSPSGDGLKVIVKTDSSLSTHEVAWKQVRSYYEHQLIASFGEGNLNVEKGQHDLTRNCIVSADNDIRINTNTHLYEVDLSNGSALDHSMPNKSASEIQKPKLTTAGIAPAFSTNLIGEVKDDKKFNKCVELTNNKLTFTKGSRNKYVHLLANNCNRHGISYHQADLLIKQGYNYDNKEVSATIKSAYKHNSGEYGRFGKSSITGVASPIDITTATATQPQFSVSSFTELAAKGKSIPKLRQVFGNYILENNLVLFPSERGTGKTFLMLQLCIAIANENKSFLNENLESHGNTIYINLELGENMLCRRLEYLYKALPQGEEQKKYQAYSLTYRGGLVDIYEKLQELIAEKQPVLVVIDNLRTALSGKDNEKNKEMTKAIMELAKLKDQYNISLVIVHHTTKGSSSKKTNSDLQSGAGALSDLVDADFFLRKSKMDSNFRILRRMKSRECEEQEGAKLIALNPETLWFEFVEEPVEEDDHVYDENINDKRASKLAEAKELREQDWTLERIAEKLGVHKSTVSRWFKP